VLRGFYFPLLLGDEVVISLDKRWTDGDEDDRNENEQNNGWNHLKHLEGGPRSLLLFGPGPPRWPVCT
jgi:hypothetical protein